MNTWYLDSMWRFLKYSYKGQVRKLIYRLITIFTSSQKLVTNNFVVRFFQWPHKYRLNRIMKRLYLYFQIRTTTPTAEPL